MLSLRSAVKCTLPQTAKPGDGSNFDASSVKQAPKLVGNDKYSARDQHADEKRKEQIAHAKSLSLKAVRGFFVVRRSYEDHCQEQCR